MFYKNSTDIKITKKYLKNFKSTCKSQKKTNPNGLRWISWINPLIPFKLSVSTQSKSKKNLAPQISKDGIWLLKWKNQLAWSRKLILMKLLCLFITNSLKWNNNCFDFNLYYLILRGHYKMLNHKDMMKNNLNLHYF